MDRRTTTTPRRPRLRFGLVALVGTALALIAGTVPSASAQSVGSLKDRARTIAAELEALDQRTNALDEEFNTANLDLESLKQKLAENASAVRTAQGQLSANRSAAQTLAVQAFIGANDESGIIGVTGDAATDSRRRAYLGTRLSDRQQVIDSLVAAQRDLADRESALTSARGKVDAKVREMERATKELEGTIADRRKLYESVSGELAAAMRAEQERIDRETAARAEAAARAAAATAQAARRPRAAAVTLAVTPIAAPAGRGSGAAPAPARAVSVAPVAPTAPKAPATPPPSNAPTAVQVALQQQGDPYLWGAAGPDRFDCSGLILFAYRAAGISLPHSSRALRSMTRSISADDLQPGDLVFGGSPIHHVGLYIGNGQMVHAPHSGDVVKVSSMYQTSKPVSFGRL